MDRDVDIYINSWQDPCVNAKINSWISQLFQAVFIELDKEIKMLGHNKMSHPLYTGAPCDTLSDLIILKWWQGDGVLNLKIG